MKIKIQCSLEFVWNAKLKRLCVSEIVAEISFAKSSSHIFQ